jgi:D-alanyl-lipoteichoic acid acyltransferase DltB (MBOAT superfamily)
MFFDSLYKTSLVLGAVLLVWLVQTLKLDVRWRFLVLLVSSVGFLTFLLDPYVIAVFAIFALVAHGYVRTAQRLGAFRVPMAVVMVLGFIGFWWISRDPQAYGLPELVPFAKERPSLLRFLGISYFGFKFVHLVVRACIGKAPQGNLLTTLSYFLLFANFVSGPINTYESFVATTRPSRWKVNLPSLMLGTHRILVGAAKVVLLAPLLRPFALDFETVLPGEAPLWRVGFSLLAYSAFLFLDFSGYSDMAIGVGRSLGLRLPENFKRPYLARDLSDFWRRWHISLSSLLRVLLFTPIVKSLSRRIPWMPRLLVSSCGYLGTFLICGVWHGRTLNFAVWGLWHGLGLTFLAIKKSSGARPLPVPVGVMVTFAFVTVGWLFFVYPMDRLASLAHRALTLPVQRALAAETANLVEGSFVFTPHANHDNVAVRIVNPMNEPATVSVAWRIGDGIGLRWLSRNEPVAAGATYEQTLKVPGVVTRGVSVRVYAFVAGSQGTRLWGVARVSGALPMHLQGVSLHHMEGVVSRVDACRMRIDGSVLPRDTTLSVSWKPLDLTKTGDALPLREVPYGEGGVIDMCEVVGKPDPSYVLLAGLRWNDVALSQRGFVFPSVRKE